MDAVYQDLDRAVAQRLPVFARKHALTCVYAYEDGARATFRAARELGLRCIYDLPIAYWEVARRLLAEEAERLPEWEPTLVGTRDSAAKLERKTQELEWADVVICPSTFVRASLPEKVRTGRACVVAEFGSPDVSVSPASPNQRALNGPLRVLFAGSLTQRKGLADVFAAMKLLASAHLELIVFGSPIAPLEFYRKQLNNFVYEAPRPHGEVLALMRTCDVLVLPSIVEGRALVQQEALGCGLPIVVTPNAGGEDLVEPGQTGYLVPIRSPEEIAAKLEWFSQNRNALPDMRAAAQRKAAEYPWSRYQQRVLDVL
ncbi:MAG: glycosyltransferase family 4 protein [Verrucomicrobiota bacterium]|nr:glycosyltransferase family 4 protein [Verrucomicrobiota bacterium]